MSTHYSYRILGMDCAEEVTILKRVVGPLVGDPELLFFDVMAGKMLVPAEVAPTAVIEAVAATGMRAELWQSGDGQDAGRARRLRALAVVIAGLAAAGGFLLQLAAAPSLAAALGEGELPLPAKVVYLVSIVAGAWFVAPKAWAAARSFRPDMNLLMVLAVIGAVAIGEYFEAATVAFLFALALALETWSVSRARRAVEALLAMAPEVVRVRAADGSEKEIPVAEAAPGTRFVVRPGERFALDGKVVAGISDVDQAPVTGESVPVEKKPGDEVFAGTINGRGALDIDSTKAPGATVLARILRRVEEARSRRSPSEQWVEKFASVYTPVVMVAAVAMAVVLPVAFEVDTKVALYRALALLVIACPCALVVATPVAVVAALAAAARRGVLLKGGHAVEAPARLKTIATDKTGTLTRGRPAVVEVVPLAEHDERELIERVAALEASSEHPIAEAIRKYAEAQGVRPLSAEGLEILPGKGAVAKIGGRPYWLGSPRLLDERGQDSPGIRARIEQLAAGGRTIVVVGNDEHVCGLLAVADEIRPEAKAFVAALHQLRLRVVMLTGDNAGTAAKIASELGLEEVQSDLLPEDKVRVIEELLARDGQVAMIGDGVNDAPALARATLGIAMGGSGTDAAIETADVALISDDLARLPWLIRHSRRTLRTIHQNVVFALVVKAVFLGLALSGLTSLWLAIAADTGATLLVVANALRLLRNH